MKLLSVADLHYTLKRFDWLIASARGFDAVLIGGDLLDPASAAQMPKSRAPLIRMIFPSRKPPC